MILFSSEPSLPHLLNPCASLSSSQYHKEPNPFIAGSLSRMQQGHTRHLQRS